MQFDTGIINSSRFDTDTIPSVFVSGFDTYRFDTAFFNKSILNILLLLSSEAGIGVDAKTSSIGTLNKTETGVGADAYYSRLALMTRPDSGSALDLALLLTSIIKSDLGIGSDASLLSFLRSVTESGVGSELKNLITLLLLAESGVGSELTHIIKPGIDDGIGTEIPFLLKLLLLDSGSGIEAIKDRIFTAYELPVVLFSLLDTMYFDKYPFNYQKLTSGIETHNLITSQSKSDLSISSSDVASLLSLYLKQDLGAGLDSALFPIVLNLRTDLGYDTELASILVSMFKSDLGVGVDLASIHAYYLRPDNGNGQDTSTINILLLRPESAAGTELALIITYHQKTDLGSGISIPSLLTVHNLRYETGSVLELANKPISINYKTELGYGNDIATVYFVVIKNDLGSGLDLFRFRLYTDNREPLLVVRNQNIVRDTPPVRIMPL